MVQIKSKAKLIIWICSALSSVGNRNNSSSLGNINNNPPNQQNPGNPNEISLLRLKESLDKAFFKINENFKNNKIELENWFKQKNTSEISNLINFIKNKEQFDLQYFASNDILKTSIDILLYFENKESKQEFGKFLIRKILNFPRIISRFPKTDPAFIYFDVIFAQEIILDEELKQNYKIYDENPQNTENTKILFEKYFKTLVRYRLNDISVASFLRNFEYLSKIIPKNKLLKLFEKIFDEMNREKDETVKNKNKDEKKVPLLQRRNNARLIYNAIDFSIEFLNPSKKSTNKLNLASYKFPNKWPQNRQEEIDKLINLCKIKTRGTYIEHSRLIEDFMATREMAIPLPREILFYFLSLELQMEIESFEAQKQIQDENNALQKNSLLSNENKTPPKEDLPSDEDNNPLNEFQLSDEDEDKKKIKLEKFEKMIIKMSDEFFYLNLNHIVNFLKTMISANTKHEELCQIYDKLFYFHTSEIVFSKGGIYPINLSEEILLKLDGDVIKPSSSNNSINSISYNKTYYIRCINGNPALNSIKIIGSENNTKFYLKIDQSCFIPKFNSELLASEGYYKIDLENATKIVFEKIADENIFLKFKTIVFEYLFSLSAFDTEKLARELFLKAASNIFLYEERAKNICFEIYENFKGNCLNEDEIKQFMENYTNFSEYLPEKENDPFNSFIENLFFQSTQIEHTNSTVTLYNLGNFLKNMLMEIKDFNFFLSTYEFLKKSDAIKCLGFVRSIFRDPKFYQTKFENFQCFFHLMLEIIEDINNENSKTTSSIFFFSMIMLINIKIIWMRILRK